MNALDFRARKRNGPPISMTTCYDYGSARILAETAIDAVLVGDSVAMVAHGYPSTVHATTDMMAVHTAAVARGAGDKFVIGDLPFLSYRKGLREAMETVDRIMKAGAQAVKLEGLHGHVDVIGHIVASGIPVMGHLGMTPQSLHSFGGFRVQGRAPDAARRIAEDAERLQDLGCFSLVLECVPVDLASLVTRSLEIPTIGIGAGPDVDGQVLVLQDLLGMTPDFRARFVRTYLDGATRIREAVDRFDAQVKEGSYPSASESYS